METPQESSRSGNALNHDDGRFSASYRSLQPTDSAPCSDMDTVQHSCEILHYDIKLEPDHEVENETAVYSNKTDFEMRDVDIKIEPDSDGHLTDDGELSTVHENTAPFPIGTNLQANDHTDPWGVILDIRPDQQQTATTCSIQTENYIKTEAIEIRPEDNRPAALQNHGRSIQGAELISLNDKQTDAEGNTNFRSQTGASLNRDRPSNDKNVSIHIHGCSRQPQGLRKRTNKLEMQVKDLYKKWKSSTGTRLNRDKPSSDHGNKDNIQLRDSMSSCENAEQMLHKPQSTSWSKQPQGLRNKPKKLEMQVKDLYKKWKCSTGVSSTIRSSHKGHESQVDEGHASAAYSNSNMASRTFDHKLPMMEINYPAAGTDDTDQGTNGMRTMNRNDDEDNKSFKLNQVVVKDECLNWDHAHDAVKTEGTSQEDLRTETGLKRKKCCFPQCCSWFTHDGCRTAHEQMCHNNGDFECTCVGCMRKSKCNNDAVIHSYTMKDIVYETTCGKCSKTYFVEINIVNRLLTVYLNQGLWIECTKCQQVSNVRLRVSERHERRRHENNAPEICSPKFLCGEKCKNERFDTIISLTLHKSKSESCRKETVETNGTNEKVRSWRCSLSSCTMRFSQIHYLSSHERRYHPVDSPNTCPCVGCQKPDRHTANYNVICSKCRKGYIIGIKRSSPFGNKFFARGVRTYCKACKIVTDDYLRMPRLVRNAPRKPGSVEFLCNHMDCIGKEKKIHYASFKDLWEHAKEHHDLEPSTPTVELASEEHEKESTNRRSIRICSKEYTRQGKKYRFHPCVQCDKVFMLPVVLERHVQKHHKQKICKKCGKAFGTEKALRMHARFHENRFCCPTCGKDFKYEQSVNNHISIFHKLSKSFNCSICKEKFWSQYAVRQHRILAHHGRKKFIPALTAFHCSACKRKFKSLSGMNRHFLKAHVPVAR